MSADHEGIGNVVRQRKEGKEGMRGSKRNTKKGRKEERKGDTVIIFLSNYRCMTGSGRVWPEEVSGGVYRGEGADFQFG